MAKIVVAAAFIAALLFYTRGSEGHPLVQCPGAGLPPPPFHPPSPLSFGSQSPSDLMALSSLFGMPPSSAPLPPIGPPPPFPPMYQIPNALPGGEGAFPLPPSMPLTFPSGPDVFRNLPANSMHLPGPSCLSPSSFGPPLYSPY